MSWLQTTKLWTSEHLTLAKDALHVYVALLLFLGCCAVFKWRLSSWKPWAVVLVVVTVGEVWDVRDTIYEDDPVRLSENVHDIWNTMVWPSVLVVLARFRLIRP